MDIASIGVFIPFAGMALGAFIVWITSKEEVEKARAKAAAASLSPDLEQRLENITARLEAVEKIVTDEDRVLRAEIDSLRDQTRRTTA